MTDEDMTHVREIAEAVVDLLADRGLVVYAGPTPAARVLKARELARLLGRSLPLGLRARDRAWSDPHG